MSGDRRDTEQRRQSSGKGSGAAPDGAVGGSGSKGGGVSSLTADGNEKLPPRPNEPKK